MKNLITTILLVFTLSTIAQEIKVKDVKHKFNGGEKFALQVNVHSDDIKDVLKAFKKEADKDAGIIVEKKGELFLDNTIIKKISDDKIDVFASVKKEKDGTSKLIVCFEINNNYITPKSKAYKKAEKFMELLAKDISVLVVAKELDKEEKGLENIKEKIKNKQEKIKNCEDDTEKRKEKIAENKKELKSVSTDLSVVLKGLNSGKGKYDKLVKQKEKLDKRHEKLIDKTAKNEAEIKNNHKKIEKAEKDIKKLEEKQQDQEKVVEKVKQKLNEIK